MTRSLLEGGRDADAAGHHDPRRQRSDHPPGARSPAARAVHRRAPTDPFTITTSPGARPILVNKIGAVGHGQTVTTMQFLSGGISLLVGDFGGGITQWFPVRDDRQSYTLPGYNEFPHRRIRSPGSRLNSPARASRPSMSPGRSGCITPPPSAPSWSSGSSSHRPTRRSRPWRCPRGRTPSWSTTAAVVCDSFASTTNTPRYRGTRCGAGCGTRAASSRSTCGSRPRPPAISSPSSASPP